MSKTQKLIYEIEGKGAVKAQKELDKYAKSLGLSTAQLKRLAAQSGKTSVGVKTLGKNFRNAKSNALMFKSALATLGVYAAGKFAKDTLDAAGAMENWAISFEVMLDSAEDAKYMLEDLMTFAEKTPFEIKGIVPTSKQLMAMGVESEDMIKTLTYLGNAAAGVGVPVQRLALNLGQVKTLGRLTGREVRDFAMAGIPLIEELAKAMGKTKVEIQEMVSAGDISFKDVENAFVSMSSEGGRFNNMMQRQSETMKGMLSNLADSFFGFKISIGDAMLPLVKEYLPDAITLIEQFTALISGGDMGFIASLRSQLSEVSKTDLLTGKKAGEQILKNLQTQYMQVALRKEDLETQYEYLSNQLQNNKLTEYQLNQVEIEREKKWELLKISHEETKAAKTKVDEQVEVLAAYDSELKKRGEIVNKLKEQARLLQSLKVEIDIPEIVVDEYDDIITPDKIRNYEVWVNELKIANENLSEINQWKEKLKDLDPELFKKLFENGKDAAKEMSAATRAWGDYTSNILYEAFGGQFDSIEDMFKNTLKRMAADLVASGLLSLLTGGAAGVGLFGASGMFGSIFGAHNGGTFTNNGGNIVKAANGLSDFVVPAGFPNDSFPIMVESGEQVNVTPANQVGQDDTMKQILKAIKSQPRYIVKTIGRVELAEEVEQGQSEKRDF
jgi:tape measure domain-containing protein